MSMTEERPELPQRRVVPPMNPHWLTLNWFVAVFLALIGLASNDFYFLILYGIGLGVNQLWKRWSARSRTGHANG